MKEKIENLKQEFIDLLTGCTISFNANDIDYQKDGSLLFYYRKSEKSLRVRYDILDGFELKYDLTYPELCTLLGDIAEEVLDVTPNEVEWFEEV